MKNLTIIGVFLVVLMACGSKKTAVVAGNDPKLLNGAWELTYVAGNQAADQLYSRKKPVLNFNTEESKVNGNTGCNSFTGGILSVGVGEIRFDDQMAMTKMFCEGQGENVFLENLRKVKTFSLTDNNQTLSLTDGSIEVMRLIKK
ncbi:META domain-containing protein [Flavobacterium caeni]|uniref:Heat shock protein HslJ n=1 Tax=Flavobacterium caeni TaxID=490189 RepID=A0A1G5CF77_9FLAO|nr:META domain-containing protein [Flavobacterium caeni]SCY00986.1 Heat shock protein HslJ [Flavobacterium caeni]